MRVILFSIGGLDIRSYGVIVALAILIGMGVAYYLTQGTMYQKHIPNLMFFVMIGAIITARIWHVFFFQWDYYASHPGEIIAIWNGGIAIQGALVGGFIATTLYSRIHRISFWGLADVVAPAIILGQAIGRVACFLNGDAFGSPTGSGFGLVYPPGTIAYEVYGSQPLWPAEVWEGQWDLLVFAILLLLKTRMKTKGHLFLSYNILYSFGRFMLEYLRGDSPRYAFGWTAGQWTSLIVVLAAVGLMIYFYLTRIPQEKEKGMA